MSKALTQTECVRRARVEFDAALSRPEPPAGPAHGHWLVWVKSRIYHAERFLDKRNQAALHDSMARPDSANATAFRDAAVLRKLTEDFWQTRIMPHYDQRKRKRWAK